MGTEDQKQIIVIFKLLLVVDQGVFMNIRRVSSLAATAFLALFCWGTELLLRAPLLDQITPIGLSDLLVTSFWLIISFVVLYF